MSSDSSLFNEHEVHEIALLATQISSDPSSLNSSLTSSPKLLIPDSLSSSLRSSTCSSPRYTPTVKFAPLPPTDPNKKRSIAPLGVSARSRRRRPLPQEEGGSLLWSTDPDVQEEVMEDPLITFGRFVKNASKTLWRRVRKKSTVASLKEDEPQANEPVLEIKAEADERPGSTLAPPSGWKGESEMGVLGGEEKRTRRASWSSSSTERRTLVVNDADAKRLLRRSTGNLPPLVFISEVAL